MKLHRCRWDKKIAGICGGLGQYFKVDPTIIRLIAIALVFLTGFIPVIVVYLIGWAFIPLGAPFYVEIPCKKLYKSRTDRKVSGVCGGLATYFKLNSNILRVALIALGCLTFGIVLVVYIAASIIIPEEPQII